MYTYLENIDEVQMRHNFPYNLIGKIKDIEHFAESIPYYKFTLYNDYCDKEYTCICKENAFEKHKLWNGDSVVIEYVPVQKFQDIGECLLIRYIKRPVMGLTGNRHDDIMTLMATAKKMIDSEFDSGAMVLSRRQQVNQSYLRMRKSYLDSRKRRKI